MRGLLTLLMVCGVLLAGCEQSAPVVTPTQVTARITTTDSALLGRLTELHVRASLRLADGSWRKPVKNSFKAAGLKWPVDIPVFPRNASEGSAQFELVAEAIQDGRVIAEARAITSFWPAHHVVLELRMFLCSGAEAVCASGCVGAECTVCNLAGECEPVTQIDPTSLTNATVGTGTDAGDGVVDVGPDGSIVVDRDATVSGETSVPGGPDMQGDGGLPMVDGGGPVTGPECSDSTGCGPGFVCAAMKCVSACTQTQCDANASCSLVSNAPVCSCNRGFIAMTGTGAAVTCAQDRACSELGCDINATCQIGTDQLRHCTCKAGYTGSGTSCAPVSCSPPSLLNGTVSAPDGYTFGSIATYRCNTGYQQAAGGSWTRTCGSDMQWSGTQPSCTAITCTTLQNPSNGTVSTPQGREVGDTATYACNTGYKLQGLTALTCEVQGWNGSAPVCLLACGDGVKDPQEACDPKNPSWNKWTCNTDCTARTAYAACPATTCAAGEGCLLGFCTKMCNASTANCTPTPAGVTQRVCLQERNPSAYDVCVASGCTSGFDCAPGLGCYTTSDGFSYCSACSGGTGGVCN